MTDLTTMPVALLLDCAYTLLAEDTKEAKEHREKLDGLLDQRSVGTPDRATWGRLPHQQRAMKAATMAGG